MAIKGKKGKLNTVVTAKHAILYVFQTVKVFPISLCVMFLASCVWAVDLSVRPYLLKVILNGIMEDSQAISVHLVSPALSYLLMYFLMASSHRFYGYFVEIKMIPRLREKIANEALSAFIDKNHNYFRNNFSGNLANKVNDLIVNVPDFIQTVIDRFFSHALALIIAIYTLWQVSPIFAIFISCWIAVFIIVALFFSRRLVHLANNWSEYASIITGKFVDVLSNILSVRLFSTKAQEAYSLRKTLEGAVKAERELQWSYFWMWTCFSYSFLFLQGFNFYFLLKGKNEGWVSIGDFALVIVISTAIIDVLWQLTKEFFQFSNLLGHIIQALREIIATPSIQDKVDATELIVSGGQIKFEQVQFYYHSTKPLFHNVSVCIEPGEKVGLVGCSGSGKSTFVNLILRLYEVIDGHILIDGQDITDVTQASLRSAIAVIPQDLTLFHRSLIDNIRYGRINATNEEVIEAAKKAHAHEFILGFPHGYESLIGEHGAKLSGGQRQRIAIARAILKNAPILILDEATSQLDPITENEIQESLANLMQSKTTIVIAHRLSTLLQMDRILVFEQGKIFECGTHLELLSKGGRYKALWDAQIEKFSNSILL